MAFIGGWAAAIAATISICVAGRLTGISPWWAGPESKPRFFLVWAVPFLPAVVAIGMAWCSHRLSWWMGILGSIAFAFFGFVDLGRFHGLGYAELFVAACSLILTLASLAGRYRKALPNP